MAGRAQGDVRGSLPGADQASDAAGLRAGGPRGGCGSEIARREGLS